MNYLKGTSPKQEKTQEQKKSEKKFVAIRFLQFVKSIIPANLKGNNMPFYVLLFLLALLYIMNSHYMEKLAREEVKYLNELKELKSEYMTINAELSTRSKQTKVKVVVDSIGLSSPKTPPYALIVKPK